MSDQATKNTAKTGGCYCGAVRYAVSARPVVRGQCHCRACQHIAGGGPQYFQVIEPEGFEWTSGTPTTFTHPNLENAVTRFFCEICGTHMLTRRQDQTGLVLKIGTLDDPTRFRPHVAICHGEAPPFHQVPDGIAVFAGLPGRS